MKAPLLPGNWPAALGTTWIIGSGDISLCACMADTFICTSALLCGLVSSHAMLGDVEGSRELCPNTHKGVA